MANSAEVEARDWKSRKCPQKSDVHFFPEWEKKPPPYLKKVGGKARSSRSGKTAHPLSDYPPPAIM